MSARPGRRPVLVASLLLACAFAAGAAGGMAADRWLPPPDDTDIRITRDFSGLFDALRLSTDQRRQARVLMEQSAPRSEAVLRQVAEQLRSVADSVDGELRKLLTPAQRARLDSLRRGPVFVLKRKTARGTVVDTLRAAPDSGR